MSQDTSTVMQDVNSGDEENIILEDANSPATAKISKSWTEHSAHVPSYSGGKVVLCKGRGARNLHGIPDNDDYQQTPFLLAPCMGDLSILDARRGTKARTLRHGVSKLSTSLSMGDNIDWDDDDDDGLDGDAILAFALSPANDADLVTASRNSIIRHYNLSGAPNLSYVGEDGLGAAKVQKILGKSGHKLPVTTMEFHCSGIFFASGSIGDGQVKVWDLRGGYATHSFLPLSGVRQTANRGTVSNLTWCDDISKLWLAIGREDGTVYVHDLRHESSQQQPLAIMNDHVSAVTCISWANPGVWDVFITAGRDAVIHTYQVIKEEQATQSKTNRKKKTKSTGANAKTDTKFIYRKIHTLPIYEQIEGMQLFSTNLLFNKFQNQIAKSDIIMVTAGSKGVIRVWRATTSETGIANGEVGRDGEVQKSISKFSCIGEQSITTAFGEEKGGYMNLSLSNHHFSEHHSTSSDYNFSAGEHLIVTDAEHNISFYSLNHTTTENVKRNNNSKKNLPDIFNLTLERTIVGHNDQILDLKVIPDMSVSKSDDELDITTQISPLDGIKEQTRIAVATNSAQVRIFTLGTFSCSILSGHAKIVLCLDVSPCGQFLCTAGKDQTMRLWDLSTERCVGIAEGHTEAIGATALSRKLGRYDVSGKSAKNGAGAFAITASKDRTIKRWNLPGASALKNNSNESNAILELSAFVSAKAHEKDINIVSVAPNDSLIATGSQDKTVKIWNSIDLKLKGTLTGHKRGIWDCQFSPFDRVLASASGDRTIKLWSLGDLSCVRSFQGHSASTLRVRFVNAGLQLLSSGADGLVKLWTIRTNECETTMDGHTDKVWALDVCPNGKEFVSGGADSKIVAWKDTTKEHEDTKKEEEERIILMEQKLANHIRFKEYEQALEIALDMEKPRNALKVLVAIIEDDIQKQNNTNGNVSNNNTLQRHVKSWPMSRVVQVLRFCRDWNTRARNSHVATLTVKAIVSSIPAYKLAEVEGVAEILAGIIPYSERHFERMDRLFASSYLIDFTLLSMGDLEDDDSDPNDFTEWEANSKFVLPPKKLDGRVQIGGSDIVGFNAKHTEMESDQDEVITLGESDTASETSSSSLESEESDGDDNEESN